MSIRNRIFLLGYALSLYLICVPLIDTGVGASPFEFGNMEWRYGTVGFFSRALEVPFLGLLIAFSLASALKHQRVLRALGVFALVGAITLLGATGVFAWDVFSVREMVAEEFQRALLISALLATGKLTAGVVVATAFSWVGLTAKRSRRA